MQCTCLEQKFVTMFVLQSAKAKTDLNANFGLFSIDGDKTLYYGFCHYHYFCCGAGHIEIVSTKFN